MSDELNENLLSYVQRLLPLFSSLLLMLFAYVPLDFLLFGHIKPLVSVICVYFWMLHRSDLFNLFSVSLLGIIDDVVSNVPMGTNFFTFLVFYVVLNNLLRFLNGKNFIVTWYGFAIVAIVPFFTKWFVLSVYYGVFLPLSVVLFSFLVTVAVYPFFSLILAFVQNNLIADEELS